MTAATDPSPRTDAEPMAFTADEFLRGVVAAWLWFNALFAPTLTIAVTFTQAPGWGPWWSQAVIVLVYAVPVALVASGVVTLLLCGSAWVLGRRLRRHRSFALHALCYTALGAAIGTLVVVAYTLVVRAPVDLTQPIAAITVGCSAAAVGLGWGSTVRRAIRIEAGHGRHRARRDVDADFEDAR